MMFNCVHITSLINSRQLNNKISNFYVTVFSTRCAHENTFLIIYYLTDKMLLHNQIN